MKIKPEHLQVLKDEIGKIWEKYDKESLILDYETGNFPRSEKVKDLQQRFCFDLFYAAKLERFSSKLAYLNDDHIFTALKSICPVVRRRY